MNNVNNDKVKKEEKMVQEITELSQMRKDLLLKYNDLLNEYNSFNYNLENVNEIAAKTHKELISYNNKN